MIVEIIHEETNLKFLVQLLLRLPDKFESFGQQVMVGVDCKMTFN